MHCVYQRDGVVDGRLRQDAVSQVEDVARPIAAAWRRISATRLRRYSRSASKTRTDPGCPGSRWVGRDHLPRVIESHAPIHPTTSLFPSASRRVQRRVAGGEVDDRYARRDAGNDLLHVRQHAVAIVVGAQAADPGIEELNSLAPAATWALR